MHIILICLIYDQLPRHKCELGSTASAAVCILRRGDHQQTPGDFNDYLLGHHNVDWAGNLCIQAPPMWANNCDKFNVFPFYQIDFLASFGGVTTMGGTMMGGHLQGGPSAVGSRGPYGRLQGSNKGLKQSWLDPNFSTSSDLGCTSVMVRPYLDSA